MLVTRAPEPRLRPYVRSYYGFREETGVRTWRREGPGAEVVLLLSFGTDWLIADAVEPSATPDRLTSFAAGLRLTSVVTEHGGLSHGMQVSFTPLGAHAFFGLPMHLLSGCAVPLDALLGLDAERLVERLVAEPDWAARLVLLERAVSKRLAGAVGPTPGVHWAWSRLVETRGRVPIAALADELGWSAKRLVSRFKDEVGVSPKSVARLLRFERASALLALELPPSLAAVAVDCGYYDQSHLTNELRRITGVTPAAYARSVGSAHFLQDEARAAS